jgi:hypothetical protein
MSVYNLALRQPILLEQEGRAGDSTAGMHYMKLLHRLASYGILSTLTLLLLLMLYASFRHDPNWHVVEEAVASSDHPFAGFWKQSNCDQPWGWAIGPAAQDSYYVSFCAPGGCQESADQSTNTTAINDDPDYLVVNPDTLRYRFEGEWVTLVRCKSRK